MYGDFYKQKMCTYGVQTEMAHPAAGRGPSCHLRCPLHMGGCSAMRLSTLLEFALQPAPPLGPDHSGTTGLQIAYPEMKDSEFTAPV